jgi:cyclophilin family peptidyl-prolyl cis-trans isomerase
LAVGLFLVFIFGVVPRLGPSGFQHCKTAAHSSFETLQDLQAFLQLLAEEHAHDAGKAKHLLSLAQQIGGSARATTVTTDTHRTGQPSVGSVTAAAGIPGTASQQQAAWLLQQLQRCQADLAAARKVIQKHEELLQKQLQETAVLKSQLQQDQQQLPHPQASAAVQAGAGAAAVGSAASCDAVAVRALAVSGDACGVMPGVEWGGNVVIWGAEHRTATAAECCAACLAHSRAIARGVGSDAGRAAQPCNAWVYCRNAETCGGRYQECWLKHDSQLTPSSTAAAAAAGDGSMWTSGVPAAGKPLSAWQAQLGLHLPTADLSVSTAATDTATGAVGSTGLTAATAPVLVWQTVLGTIRVHLLPELAPGSVGELTRMGMLLTVSSNGQCSNCRIYRAEQGFLVQGIVEAPGAYVAVPRHPNPPQRKVMQRGLVCWAGGGGGPDWFVNMIDQSGFQDDHLCFGQVDRAGLEVCEKILRLPVKPKGGADSVEMVLLQQDVRFDFTIEKTQPVTLG